MEKIIHSYQLFVLCWGLRGKLACYRSVALKFYSLGSFATQAEAWMPRLKASMQFLQDTSRVIFVFLRKAEILTLDVRSVDDALHGRRTKVWGLYWNFSGSWTRDFSKKLASVVSRTIGRHKTARMVKHVYIRSGLEISRFYSPSEICWKLMLLSAFV